MKKETRLYVFYSAKYDELFTISKRGEKDKNHTLVWTVGKNNIILTNCYYIGKL